MTEEWRAVPGHEGVYEVSSFGRVKSLDRILVKDHAARGYPRPVKGKLLKPKATVGGYLFVSLSSADGVKGNRYVSHLVAEAYIGPRPCGMQVAHNDGVRGNNCEDNLRYATRSENEGDKEIHGTRPRGEAAWNAKLSDADIAKIRELGGSLPQSAIGKMFGIKQPAVSDYLNRRRRA